MNSHVKHYFTADLAAEQPQPYISVISIIFKRRNFSLQYQTIRLLGRSFKLTLKPDQSEPNVNSAKLHKACNVPLNYSEVLLNCSECPPKSKVNLKAVQARRRKQNVADISQDKIKKRPGKSSGSPLSVCPDTSMVQLYRLV